jgi:antitoxin VapB
MAISTVFINNRTQAVRLPAEMRLPEDVKLVNVRALGNERIITLIAETWDSLFNANLTVSDDFMPTR